MLPYICPGTPQNRLADLDVDVSDIVFYKKFPTLVSRDDAIFTRERSGLHANPEDDGEGILFLGVPDFDISMLFHCTFIESKRAQVLRPRSPSQALRIGWLPAGRSSLGLWYGSGPVGASHGVVLLRATRIGREFNPP